MIIGAESSFVSGCKSCDLSRRARLAPDKPRFGAASAALNAASAFGGVRAPRRGVCRRSRFLLPERAPQVNTPRQRESRRRTGPRVRGRVTAKLPGPGRCAILGGAYFISRSRQVRHAGPLWRRGPRIRGRPLAWGDGLWTRLKIGNPGRCYLGAAATRWCRSASGGTSRRRCQARAQLELNYGHVPQLENSPRDPRGGARFLSAPEGSEVAAAAEVPAAEAAAEVPAAEVPEVAAADRVLDSPVGGIGISETAEGTAEHRADE